DPAIGNIIAIEPARVYNHVISVLTSQEVSRDGRLKLAEGDLNNFQFRTSRRLKRRTPEIDGAGDTARRALTKGSDGDGLAVAESMSIWNIGGLESIPGCIALSLDDFRRTGREGVIREQIHRRLAKEGVVCCGSAARDRKSTQAECHD